MCNILYALHRFPLMDPAIIVPTEHQEMVMNRMAWAGPITEWKAGWGTPTSTLCAVTLYTAHNSGLKWATELWSLHSYLASHLTKYYYFTPASNLSIILDMGSIDSDEQHSTNYCHPWPWPHPNKTFVLQIQVLQPFWINQLISVL